MGSIYIIVGVLFLSTGTFHLLKKFHGFPSFFDGVIGAVLLLFANPFNTSFLLVVVIATLIFMYIMSRGRYSLFNITAEQTTKFLIENYKGLKVERPKGYNKYGDGSVIIDFNDGLNELVIVNVSSNKTSLKLQKVKDKELRKKITSTIKEEINKTKKINKISSSTYLHIAIGLVNIGFGYMYIVVIG